MSNDIRVFLFIGSLFVFTFIILNIRKSKMVISDSIYWFIFAFIIVIMAAYPELVFFLARTLKVSAAANLIYLIMIGLLLIRVFQLDMRLSQTNTKLQKLVQDSSIYQAEQDDEKLKQK